MSSIERARRLRRHPVTFFHTKHGGGVHPTTTKVDQLLEMHRSSSMEPINTITVRSKKKKWVLRI